MPVRSLPFALLAAACVAHADPPVSPGKSEVPMKSLLFERDVKGSMVRDMEKARAAPVPTELVFRVDGPPRIVGADIRLSGVLANPTSRDIEIVVFPVVNWANPFYVRLATDERIGYHPPRPGEPPRPPPAPPPPMQIVVPARSEVVFEGGDELRHYLWTGTPRARVEWQFLFWNEPKPSGAFELELPPPLP